MKKIIIATLLVLSYHSLAHVSTAIDTNNPINDFSNIYADQLIAEFDRRLDDPSFKGLDSELYYQILAARSIIESTGGASAVGVKSLVSVDDTVLYNLVIETIEGTAKSMIESRSLKNSNSNELQIYPSLGWTGNLTGNTYPSNAWSLTFDDGPRGSRTEKFVDNLYTRGIKANFFMLTQEAKSYPKTVEYVRDSGMEISLHSYTHANLDKANSSTLIKEIKTAKKELEKISETTITLFRLPYGAGTRNTQVRKMIADNKMVHVFWNVDTLDWKDKNPYSVFTRTKKQMALTPKKSGIILFHDIHQTTIKASELVMDYLLNQSKNICTVSEMVDYHNGIQPECLKN